MDPLSIALGALHAANLVGQCALRLNDLATRYSQASLTMSSISAECSTIQAQLYEVQRYTSEQSSHCEERFALQPQLLSALHTSLTSCVVTFSILDIEIKKTNPQTTMNFMNKMRFFWKDSTMKELLQQMRAQSAGITALLTAVQCNVSRDTIKIQQDNTDLLTIIANRQRADRDLYPEIDKQVAESVVTKEVAESIFSRSSTLGEVEFSFDDQIVNSQAYRRVLERLSAGQSRFPPTVMEPIPESNMHNYSLSPHGTTKIPQSEDIGALIDLASSNSRNIIPAVIIGINIGRGVSSVSWQWLSTPNNVNHIIFQPSGQWCVSNNISYNRDGTGKAWGDNASAHRDCLTGFPTLLLSPEHHKQYYKSQSLKELLRLAEKYKKTPAEMLQDFFRHLLEYTCAEIDIALNRAFENLPLRIIVSPPSGWEANGIQMKDVFKKALSGDENVELLIVKESEAAILGISETLENQFNRKKMARSGFQNSWSFDKYALRLTEHDLVVCNIGYNALDIKVYTVVNLENLQLSQISSTTYYKCGSAYLRHALKNVVNSKLPSEFFDEIKPEDLRQLHASLTSIMTQFTEKNTGCEHIMLPQNAVSQLPQIRRFFRGNKIHIPSDEFHAIFHSACCKVVENIKDALKSCANSPNEAIFLTGPFMHSKYLRGMLKKTFMGLEIYRSHDAEARRTEITRGLILRGAWMGANRKSI